MLAAESDAPSGASLDPGFAHGSLVGKRYTDGDEALLLLCTKSGDGTLSLDGAKLEVKAAASLPASD